MRGAGFSQTHSFAPWVWMLCAVLAAAGSCSIAQAQRVGEPDDQTVLAVPRIGLRGAAGIAQPQPLSPSEATRVRRIFAFQATGAMADAARETDRLENRLLLGAILANRYLSPSYRPTTTELTSWLARFGDEPDAPAITALLNRLAPDLARAAAADLTPAPVSARGRKSAGSASVRSLFMQNRDADAVAAASRLPSGAPAGADAADARMAGGWSGLAAWRDPDRPRPVRVRLSCRTGGALRASSAFWAARAAQRLHYRAGSVIWLRRAGEESDPFYPAIARRALGPSLDCTAGATIGEADVDALLGTTTRRRAMASPRLAKSAKRRPSSERYGSMSGKTRRSTGRSCCSRVRPACINWPRWSSRTIAPIASPERLFRRHCGRMADSWSIRRWCMQWCATS